MRYTRTKSPSRTIAVRSSSRYAKSKSPSKHAQSKSPSRYVQSRSPSSRTGSKPSARTITPKSSRKYTTGKRSTKSTARAPHKYSKSSIKALKKWESGQHDHGHGDEAMTLYADADLLEVGLTALYHDHKNWAGFSTKFVSMKVVAPPRVRLCADPEEDHNITLVTPIAVVVAGIKAEVKVSIRGKVEINNTVVCLGGLDIEIDEGRWWVKRVINYVFDRLNELWSRSTQYMYLGALQKVFGRELNASLVKLAVELVDGVPYLCLMANIGEKHQDVQRALVPESIEKNPPPEGEGSLLMIIPERILQTFANGVFDGYSHRLKTNLGGDNISLRTKGSIEIGRLELCLANNRIHAGLPVSFDKVKVGVELLGETAWQKARVKRVRAGVEMTFDNSSDGRRSRLKIKQIDKIKVKVKKRGEPFEKDIRRVIKDASNTVTRILKERLEGKAFTLLQLSEQVPGTKLPMKVRGRPVGLSVQGNAIVASLVISIDGGEEISKPARCWDFRTVRGARLHLRQRGAGVPIVFIHDLGFDLECWSDQVNHFARDFGVLAYDWRGMGESGGGRFPYRMKTLAEDLHQLIEELDMHAPVLVGQGMGAAIAVAYAHAHPDRVGGVAICESAGAPMEPALSVSMSGVALDDAKSRLWSDDYREQHPEVVEAWQGRLRANSTWALLSARFASDRGTDARELLAELRAPVLLIRGPGQASTLEAPRLREVVLDTPSNMPMIEQSEAFNAALEPFLSEVIEEEQAEVEREHQQQREALRESIPSDAEVPLGIELPPQASA